MFTCILCFFDVLHSFVFLLLLISLLLIFFFFFQAEDGIRVLVRSRGLGDVYKRQAGLTVPGRTPRRDRFDHDEPRTSGIRCSLCGTCSCLLYTSDAADDLLCVELGGRRIITKKKKKQQNT